MTVIRKQDVISSVADALQYISYYHHWILFKRLKRPTIKKKAKRLKMQSLKF